jgi:hypothetical protein
MPDNDLPTSAANRLDEIVRYCAGASVGSNTFTQAEVQAEVLAAYLTFQEQKSAAIALQATYQTTANLQSSTLIEMRRHTEELAKQAKYTKWLAGATTTLAVVTLLVAVLH